MLELTARASLLGDHAAALAALEAWVPLLPTLRGQGRIHPEFAPLRSDPRFQRLMARVRRP